MSAAPIDLVALADILGGMLFAPDVAGAIAPYAVIVVSATTGASFALGRRMTVGRWSGFGFFLRINALAAIGTIGLATILQPWAPAGTAPAFVLSLVAFAVGAIGDDWPALGRWAFARLGRLVDAWIERRTGGGTK